MPESFGSGVGQSTRKENVGDTVTLTQGAKQENEGGAHNPLREYCISLRDHLLNCFKTLTKAVNTILVFYLHLKLSTD